MDLDADRVAPEADDLRVERLAGGDGVPERRQLAQLRPLGDGAVLGGGHAEHVHALALGDVEPLLGVEAGVVQQRRGAHQPGGDEHVAGGLRPARRGGAPGQVAVAGAEPVLGLDPLAGQVALAVADRLRLAGGART